MDDSCAVCAETLEWVAYGPCGHREVCTICVARLRFICNDRRCCICKAESDIVFATKALGDYSRVISDFSLLPSELKEGRVGSYWYHEDTQSLFDDLEHYKMIKAMCRLSCSECDKMEGHQIDGGAKHRGRFRNIDQLKGHLHHQHKLIMCSLCLEGRKVFICEQKLYTKEQLKHHISSGDSEVDGTESERGGFTGHPLCDFCRSPFYGDNELYTHMSTEHFKCHICQSQHPGQYEYYKNYDDMEVHFRREHFLCEDETCLAKKFIVFQHESQIKRHNTLEHGGRMSRSKRSAALQIPTSFRYRRSNDGENHHGREVRRFGDESSENHLAMAIQASLETANSTVRADSDSSSSHAQSIRGHGRISDIDSIVESFESFTTTDGERSTKYRQAVSNSMNALEETAFPPLPGNQQNTKRNAGANSTNYSMAAHLQRKNKKKAKVSSPAPAWPFVNRGPIPSSSASVVKIIHTRSTTTDVASSSIRQSSSASSSSSSHSSSASKIIHSSSAPNLVSNGQVLDFPPVSSVVRKVPNQTVLKVDDVQTANKSLVERIRLALNFDEEKYSIFKTISGEYRQGLVDTEAYLAYVQEFGLLHLVVELARLCPDVNKQRELIDTYKVNFARLGYEDNGENGGNESKKGKGKEKEKGKGKHVAAVVERGGGSREKLADDIMATVHKLQSDFRRPSEEGGAVEVLLKDGYRGGGGKGKSKVVAIEEPREKTVLLHAPPQPPLPGPSKGVEVVGKSSKQQQQRKKTSKFHRVRLGDGSVEGLLDIRQDDHRSASVEEKDNLDESKLPVRGVWKNGGGLKLLAKTK